MTHQHKKFVGSAHWIVAVHFVCFRCRYTAKAERFMEDTSDRRCPHCQQLLINCGRAFKTPKRLNDKGWKIAEKRYQWHIKNQDKI